MWEGYNEIEVAKKTAEAPTRHITQQEYIEALPDIVSKLDDPTADPWYLLFEPGSSQTCQSRHERRKVP